MPVAVAGHRHHEFLFSRRHPSILRSRLLQTNIAPFMALSNANDFHLLLTEQRSGEAALGQGFGRPLMQERRMSCLIVTN
jgi:hypothetical protein